MYLCVCISPLWTATKPFSCAEDSLYCFGGCRCTSVKSACPCFFGVLQFTWSHATGCAAAVRVMGTEDDQIVIRATFFIYSKLGIQLTWNCLSSIAIKKSVPCCFTCVIRAYVNQLTSLLTTYFRSFYKLQNRNVTIDRETETLLADHAEIYI